MPLTFTITYLNYFQFIKGGFFLIKKYIDKTNHFAEVFNTKTGAYIRTGVLTKEGKDTGIDPFMRDFPGLIDIGIMGHCVHGASGLCAKSGVQCYQNGLKTKEPNMSLENFKKIVDECKDKCFQFALGGRGDVDQHENFEEILQYCVENDIVPNFTTSGLGLTQEKADICKKYCGAIAISQYSRLNLFSKLVFRKLDENDDKRVYKSIDEVPVLFTLGNTNPNCYISNSKYIINGKEYKEMEITDVSKISTETQKYELFRVYDEMNTENNYTMNAVKTLLDTDIKTNIHYVLGNNTIDEAIIRLKFSGFPKGINAVIFLLHKPVGLGKSDNVLSPNDPRLTEFFNLVDNHNKNFKIGFDSCTIPAILNYTTSIARESIDSCEGGRYSMYITSDMKAIPCSFDNQDLRWAYDISNDTIYNAWNSEQFNDFRGHFKKSCLGCKDRLSCYGGCPIKREIVLCDRKEKNLYI
jgi:radical SAM protein with 4Fe4S-binding SPASM domain